jgi:predicted acylesterase/phospholipase RssA
MSQASSQGLRIVQARIRSTAPPLRVAAFLPADTPGHVGVALSGGGSRALVAGMGQLRALASLSVGGRSLLSQVKAISAVSGGAWLAAPYTYLQGEVTDEDFLGALVPPEELRAVCLPGEPADVALDELRPGNIGRVPADRAFSPGGLALQSFEMTDRYGVSDSQLWQALIARSVLAPYGLFPGWEEARGEPSTLFSYDAATLSRDVLADSPALSTLPVHLYADRLDPRRARRPFLVLQGSLLLTHPGEERKRLCQLQMTPFFAGVVGRPEGVDAQGQPVTGSVVPPFALAGVVCARDGERVTIEQERPFTLADAVGVSSAFFSDILRNLAPQLRNDPALRESLEHRMGEGPDLLPAEVKERLRRDAESRMEAEVEELTMSDGFQRLSSTDLYVPSYSIVGPGSAIGGMKRTVAADGGSLDNTAITSLLTYEDIDSVIAFQNAFEPLVAAEHGVLDERGVEIPDSRVRISGQIPPLFGYQPYREGVGYRLYANDPEPVWAGRAFQQVFEAAAFVDLLRALWESSGRGSLSAPALARLRLRVLANPNLGVRARGGPGDEKAEPITLVMTYTTRARAFYDRLHPTVRAVHGPFDDAKSCDSFPHYPTGHTYLGATKVNLLAHLTAWSIADPSQAEVFRSLFR